MPKTKAKKRVKSGGSKKPSGRRLTPPAGPHPRMESVRLRPFWEVAGVGYFAYRLILTAKLFDSMLFGTAAMLCGLSPPQLRIIAQLGLLTTGTVRSLAEGAFVDGAEVSRAVTELQRRRLVRRMPNRADARSSLFELTATGQRVYSDSGKYVWSLLKPTLKGLTKQELDVVDRVLWQLSDHCLATDRPDPKVAKEWL